MSVQERVWKNLQWMKAFYQSFWISGCFNNQPDELFFATHSRFASFLRLLCFEKLLKIEIFIGSLELLDKFFHELIRLSFQSYGELEKVQQPNIPAALFNISNIGVVQGGAFREIVLGHVEVFAQGTDGGSKGFQDFILFVRFCRHFYCIAFPRIKVYRK